MQKVFFFISIVLSLDSFSQSRSSCASQSGHWSDIATEQTSVIRSAIESLRSKAKCTNFVNAFNLDDLDKINRLKDQDLKDPDKAEPITTFDDIQNLRNFTSGESGQMNPAVTKAATIALATKTLSSASIYSAAAEKIKSSVKTGINFSNKVMSSVSANLRDPEFAGCISSGGAPIAQLLMSSVKLGNSLNKSNFANAKSSNNLVGNFLDLIKNDSISQALNQDKTFEYWNDLSCLIESTTDSYCSIRDAQDLNIQITKYNNIAKKKIEKNSKYNPLEAYFVLRRDVPNVSRWLLDVLFGNEPVTTKEAERKNEVWETAINLIKDENKVIGTINEKVIEIETIFKNASGDNGKKAKIIEILGFVISELTRQWEGVNFITSNYPETQLPFLLIGKKNAPPPVTGIYGSDFEGKDNWIDPECGTSYNARIPYSWKKFLVNSGEFHCSLDNPDEVLNVITYNFRKIMLTAKSQLLDYMNDFLVIDKIDLVSSLYKDVGISVYESMHNIYNYLFKFKKRLVLIEGELQKTMKSRKTTKKEKIKIKKDLLAARNMLGNIEELLPKLDRVFSELESESKISKKKSENFEEEKRIANAKVIKTVFQEFNVLLQQSNFFKRRIETFAMYDMRLLVRDNEMSDYLKNWMIVSGASVMSEVMDPSINSGFNVSYALKNEDIKNALAISNKNLSVMETFVKDHFVGAIYSLDAVIKGDYGRGKYIWRMTKELFKNENSYVRAKFAFQDAILMYDTTDENLTKAEKERFTNLKAEATTKYINKQAYMPTKPWETFKGFFGSIRNMVAHKDRYPWKFQWDPDAVLLTDVGGDGSYEWLKSKYCIQSLSFIKNRSFIASICKGSEISNPYVDAHYTKDDVEERRLKLSYNHFLTTSAKNHRKNVCSYRDYIRNNEALVLLDEINKSE